MSQPTTPTLISIRNKSSLSDKAVSEAIAAVGKQLARDYAPVWGLSPGLEFVPEGQEANGNAFGTIEEIPNDNLDYLGFHSMDYDGTITGTMGAAYFRVFVTREGDWRSTLSHEVLELCLNPAANRWADGVNGKEHAMEASDADESSTYNIDGIPCSNFVYPAFFNAFAGKGDRLDHMGNLSTPLETGKAGYQIVRTMPSEVEQIYNSHSSLGHSVYEVVHAEDRHDKKTILVIFGREYPEEKKLGKISKVRSRFTDI